MHITIRHAIFILIAFGVDLSVVATTDEYEVPYVVRECSKVIESKGMFILLPSQSSPFRSPFHVTFTQG